MKISFMGGQNAGIIGLLTLLALKHEITCVVGYDETIKSIINLFNIPVFESVKDKGFKSLAKKSDILICVHGKEILKDVNLPKKGCYNVHPYLYAYKGSNPIGRAIKDNNGYASVGFHRMTKKVDEGKVIFETYKRIALSDYAGTYNQIYPLYVKAIVTGLEKI